IERQIRSEMALGWNTGKSFIMEKANRMALIDSMNFNDLMDFEDSHSISLGNPAADTSSASGIKDAAEAVVQQLDSTGAFVVPGLGKFVRVQGKSRKGRNPATGDVITIPAKKIVKFSR